MNLAGRLVALLMALLAAFLQPAIGAEGKPPPRLILQITVDQLRGDLPDLVLDRVESGGFRYLAEQGVWYANAHHPHANTETIVGHVTLATGAYPSRHGMVSNVWFDAEDGRLRYNIEDADYDAVGGVGARDMDSEVDRSQVSRTEGRSPRNIITTTYSDEHVLAYGDKAKVFAVSGKDRGAVSLAGHMGKAFWYSTRDGGFASSTYYYDDFPQWVYDWNARRKADRYYDTAWELTRDISTYRYGAQDDRPYENAADLGFGRVFPHPYGPKGSKYYYTLLMASPVADELTVDFAKEIIRNENLGGDDIPDFLAVGLSSTDYVGHTFGPASLESEENLLRLDRTLADLFAYVDQTAGLDNTLIVLSADHGVPEAPQYMTEKGLEAGYIDLDALDFSGLDKALKARFGFGKEVIRMTYHPYVYLDHALMKENQADAGEVSSVIANALIEIAGIAYAIPSSALVAGQLPDAAPIARQVLRNFSPKRSGDIYIIYQPHWVPTATGDVALLNHGSPWRYDTYVPIIFAGNGLNPSRIHRPVETVDVAATLAAYMKIKPPSGSVGKPLDEVLSATKRNTE